MGALRGYTGTGNGALTQGSWLRDGLRAKEAGCDLLWWF
jgi:hypothetical protein